MVPERKDRKWLKPIAQVSAIIVLGLIIGCEGTCGRKPPAHIIGDLQPVSGFQTTESKILVSGKTSPQAIMGYHLYQGNQVIRRDYVGKAGEDGRFQYEFPLTKSEITVEGARLPLPPGDYQLQVVAKNVQGNEVSEMINFSIVGVARVDTAELASKERNKVLADKIAQADKLNAEGQYGQALALLETISGQDRPQEKIEQAKKALAEDKQRKDEEVRRQAAQEQIARGDELAKAGQQAEAIAAWESVSKQYRPQDKIDQARKRLTTPPPDPERLAREAAQEQIARGEKLAKAGKLADAITIWESIADAYRPQDKIEQAKRQQQKADEEVRYQMVQTQIAKGDELAKAGKYGEAIATWEGVEQRYRPGDKILQTRKTQAQAREQEGDKYAQAGKWGDALAVWKSISGEYASPELGKKISEIETRLEWNQKELKIDQELANYKGTEDVKNLEDLKGIRTRYEAIPSQYRSGEWQAKVAALDIRLAGAIPPPPSGGPLQKAVELIKNRQFQEAISLLQGIPNGDPGYNAARWNIAILSITEETVKNTDMALSELETIAKRDNSVYVPFYRGLAHYQKARSLTDLNDAEQAEEEYAKAIEALEEAYSKRTSFSTQKLRDVPLARPEDNLVDLHYFMGVAYYFLYKYGTHNYRDEGLINKYKLNARDNLERYIKYSGQTAMGAQREKEAMAKLAELRQ